LEPISPLLANCLLEPGSPRARDPWRPANGLDTVHADGKVLYRVSKKLAAEFWVLKEQRPESAQEILCAIAVLLQSPQVSGDLPMKLGIVPPFFLTIQQQEESQRNGQTRKRGQPHTSQRHALTCLRLRLLTDNVQSVRHNQV